MTFEELVAGDLLRDRTLFALHEDQGDVTLSFDRYHGDDEKRALAGMEYRLDVSVARNRFRVESGPGERLHRAFSGDFLQAEIAGDEMRLVCDCSFYDVPEGNGIVLVLAGGEANVVEYLPTSIVPAGG